MFLDANAVFLPITHGIGLEPEVERLVGRALIEVPTSVRRELERLRERGVPHAVAAIALADRFPDAPNEGEGDAAIIALARGARGWVVTADRDLRARLIAAGVGVLYPRDRARLDRQVGDPAPASRGRRRGAKSGNG